MILKRGGSRIKKLVAILAAALIAMTTMAVPSWAEVDGQRDAKGHYRNLEVDQSRDFVLLENYPLGAKIRVDVLDSAGATKGTYTGVTQEDPKGKLTSMMEINHLGADPDTGENDCWQGTQNPDIIAGDKVIATVLNADGTDSADIDYTFVRNLDFLVAADGTVSGTATGNEKADGSGIDNLSLKLDPATGDFIEAKQVVNKGTSRQNVSVDPNTGAISAKFPNADGEITLQYFKGQATGDAGEGTVSFSSDTPREILPGCPNTGGPVTPPAKTATTSTVDFSNTTNPWTVNTTRNIVGSVTPGSHSGEQVTVRVFQTDTQGRTQKVFETKKALDSNSSVSIPFKPGKPGTYWADFSYPGNASFGSSSDESPRYNVR